MKTRLLIISFILNVFFVFGQENVEQIPRDTSFTVWSAGQKIKKEFPEAVAVVEFQICQSKKKEM